MVQIDWLGGLLDVRRIVLGETLAEATGEKFRRVAEAKGLAVSGEDTEARKGDLWVGCIPRHGWTEVRAGHVGLVRPSDVSLALTLAQLRRGRLPSESVPAEPGDQPLVVDVPEEQRRQLPPEALAGDYARATGLQAADL
jgi:hypothetical protein